MNRIRTIFMVTVVAGLLAPAASAGWSSYGDNEPNTKYDTQEVMWHTTDTSADTSNPMVYLNAFASNTAVLGNNPNNGVTGSKINPTPLLYWFAPLGIWKDCNNDGYIGLAETAAAEYRSEVLLADDDGESICPPNTLHNKGGWVVEMLTIGMRDPCVYVDQDRKDGKPDPTDPCKGYGDFIPNPNVIYVNGTSVWGDQGYPGMPNSGGSCAIRPHDPGTFSNTGMMLRAADCIVGYRVANTTNTVNRASPVDLGIGFEDERNPHKGNSTLSQNTPVSVFGNPNNHQVGLLQQNTTQPTARVWTCNGGQASPSASVHSDPTNASLFDTVEYAFDGVTAGADEIQTALETYNTQVRPVLNQIMLASGRTTDPDYFRNQTMERNDCDDKTRTYVASQYRNQNLYGQNPSGAGLIEGANPPSAATKVDNSFAYTFYEEVYDRRESEIDALLNVTGDRTPVDFGVGVMHGWNGPLWMANVNYVSVPQSINRATFMPSSASYWTTYAFVNSTAETASFAFPGGQNLVYGYEVCGETIGKNAPPQKGWNCDPTQWWKNSNGGSTRAYYDDEITPIGAVIGDPYNLRDTDCYDGTLIAGTPIRASLTDLSPGYICDQSTPIPGFQPVRDILWPSSN